MMRFPRLTGRGSEATIKRAVKHGWEGLTDVGSVGDGRFLVIKRLLTCASTVSATLVPTFIACDPASKEGGLQHVHHPVVEAGFLALPRASDVERLDPMLSDKPFQVGRLVGTSVPGQMEAWLAVFPRKADGPQRATCYFRRQRKHHRAVVVPDVPLGPLEVGCGWSLSKLVAGRDGTFQALASFRAPTSMR